MSISWFWYVYLAFFVVYGGWGYSIYFKEKDTTFSERLFFPVSLILCIYVFLDYFAIISPNMVPYLSLSLAGFTVVYLGYEYISGCKELFEDSDDDELQRGSASTSHSNNSKYELLSAVSDSGEAIINLDAYKKPVNPAELGGAIAKMFSNKSTAEELVDATEVFNDATSSEDEDDDEAYEAAGMYIATVLAFIQSAPLVYVSYLLFIREFSQLNLG